MDKNDDLTSLAYEAGKMDGQKQFISILERRVEDVYKNMMQCVDDNRRLEASYYFGIKAELKELLKTLRNPK